MEIIIKKMDNSKNSNRLLNDGSEINSKIFLNKKNINDDLYLQSSLFTAGEKESIEKKIKKSKEKKIEKKFIVDNINNIFATIKEPKLKLLLQEILLYFIVLLVGIYYWIFLFLTGIKYERNYYFTDNRQLNVCSEEHICDYSENSANIIIYNTSFKYSNFSSDPKKLYIEESNILNHFYRAYFIEYSKIMNKYKLFKNTHSESGKPILSIVILNKEKWNIFRNYFSMCEFESFYFSMVIIITVGGIIGSFLFGLLSDIYGRKIIIQITLCISTISTFGIYLLCSNLDLYYRKVLKNYPKNCSLNEALCDYNIIPFLYAQGKTKDLFKYFYALYLFFFFLLGLSLWPLSKSSFALLVENSKGELEILFNFRIYNLAVHGLPPLCTFLIFVALNNITLTFFILGMMNLVALVFSPILLNESVRYFYEYCEWEKMTNIFLNFYKINLKDFRTLNETQYKKFKKSENSKSLYKMQSYKYNTLKNNTIFDMKQSYYKNFVVIYSALKRNIKRKNEFIIKLEDIKSYQLLVVISLWANYLFINSKYLLLIILILLSVIMDLFLKEIIEPPFLSMNDFYFGIEFNYIINSIFFIYLIVNISSNFFHYLFYRIEYFKKVIYISQLVISATLILYYILITHEDETPMDLNEYNPNMTTFFLRDIRKKTLLLLLFIIYFSLNGVIFYVNLIILKISKTIHRCTLLSLHSIALIIAMIITELIYFYMEFYFLFLAILNLFCLLIFIFLDEFSEIIHTVNDLKVIMFDISSNNNKEKEKSL